MSTETDVLVFRITAILQILTYLSLILLTWRRWWVPNNASKWEMGFNLAFKGLKCIVLKPVSLNGIWSLKVGRIFAPFSYLMPLNFVCALLREYDSIMLVISEGVFYNAKFKYNNVNSQLDAKITNFIDNYNQLNMFRAMISPILKSTRLCLQLVL